MGSLLGKQTKAKVVTFGYTLYFYALSGSRCHPHLQPTQESVYQDRRSYPRRLPVSRAGVQTQLAKHAQSACVRDRPDAARVTTGEASQRHAQGELFRFEDLLRRSDYPLWARALRYPLGFEGLPAPEIELGVTVVTLARSMVCATCSTTAAVGFGEIALAICQACFCCSGLSLASGCTWLS